MSQRTLTPSGSGTGPRRADEAELARLRWRIEELQEQVRRLERERREFALLAEQHSLMGEGAWREEIVAYLRERTERLTILRDGRPVPRREVPPEAVLDLLELTRWRTVMGETPGLVTLLMLRDGIGFREANNSPLQVPALMRCAAACRQSLAVAARHWSHDPADRPVPRRCPACGRALHAAPLALGEAGPERAVLGWLVAHDPPAPAAPHRRLLELAARWFSRRAEDEYLLQLHMVRQMTLVAVADASSRRVREEATRLREELARVSRQGADRDRALRELEEAYRRARETVQRAERESLAKDLFLAAMSHEIRTPLTCVIGFADLLTLPGVGEREAAEFARSIRQSGQLLLSLINNILDISKLEAGRLELDRLPYAPAAVVESVAEILGPAAREKGLDFTVDVAPDAAEGAVGDAARLEQILMNLVGNAVKFTTAGGIVVKVRRRRENGDWLELTVVDSGPGIPPEQREAVFEPFTQLERSRERGQGTGLGLAIARSLARAMGGDLGVDDAPGGGSLFTCRIPWVLPEQELFTPDGGAVGEKTLDEGPVPR